MNKKRTKSDEISDVVFLGVIIAVIIHIAMLIGGRSVNSSTFIAVIAIFMVIGLLFAKLDITNTHIYPFALVIFVILVLSHVLNTILSSFTRLLNILDIFVSICGILDILFLVTITGKMISLKNKDKD